MAFEIPVPAGNRPRAAFLSPYRRRRIFWSLALFATLVFFLSSRTPHDPHHDHRRFSLSWGAGRTHKTTPRISEIHGLLHMVAFEPERVFDPAVVDVTVPLTMNEYTGSNLDISDAEWVNTVRTLHSQYPVIVFSKTYCPYSKRAKDLLATYDIHPPPKYVELDLREDQLLMKGLLMRLTSRGTVPNAFLIDTSLGGSDDLQALHESGQLRRKFQEAGVEVRGNVDRS